MSEFPLHHTLHVDVVVDLKRNRFIQHCNKKTKLQNTVSQTQTLTLSVRTHICPKMGSSSSKGSSSTGRGGGGASATTSFSSSNRHRGGGGVLKSFCLKGGTTTSATNEDDDHQVRSF